MRRDIRALFSKDNISSTAFDFIIGPRPFSDTYRSDRDRRSNGKCMSVQVPSNVYNVIRSLTLCPTVDQNSNRIKTSDRQNGLSSRTRYSDYPLCPCTATPSHETLSKRNSYGSAVESVISRWFRGYCRTRPMTRNTYTESTKQWHRSVKRY